MAEHTPGPWFISKKGGRHCVDASSGEEGEDYRIALTWRSPFSPVPEQAAANARLIAAAPDLLAACLAFHEAMDTIDDRRRDRRLIAAEKLAKAAIVRAGGRTIGPD
jgi:hypothetical protein